MGRTSGGAGGSLVGTAGLVYDGVTDNYTTIVNALANEGVCVAQPGLGQLAVSKPILLGTGQGLEGFADVNPAGNTLNGVAIIPTAGFSGALTAGQQAAYPALGATAAAPVVMAGTETFVRGLIVDGLTVCTSAIIVGNSQPDLTAVGAIGGSATTILDLGNGSGQGKMVGVVIRAAGVGNTVALDLETADWMVSNLRATGGAKIFNSAGMLLATAHLTGSTTGKTYNTLISAPCRMANLYVDSGAVTDLIQVNLGSSSESVMLSNIEAVNNSAALITNILNNLSTGTGGLNVEGLQLGSSSHNFTALLANAQANDVLRNIHLNSAHLTSAAPLSLFPNGTPGYYDVVTY